MSWFFRKLQNLWDPTTQLCSLILLSSLNTCIIFIPGFAGFSHSTETRVFRWDVSTFSTFASCSDFHFLAAVPLPQTQTSHYYLLCYKHSGSCKCQVLDHYHAYGPLMETSFRQAVANAGGIKISHKFTFLLTLAWMFLASFSVITGTIHAWYGARNVLTPNQDTSNVNVMNAKSGNCMQYTGREAAVKHCIIDQCG